MRWTYVSILQTKTSLGACRKCLCWLPGLSGSPADQPQSKPAGQMYSASGVVRSAVADQQIGDARTSLCRWPLEPQRSTLVTTCLSSLLAHTPGQHYSNQCATLRMHGRVWLQTPHPVNAENTEADVASRNMTRWQWRRVDRCWGRTKALHPANGRGRKLWWCRNRVVTLEDNSLAEKGCISIRPIAILSCPCWAWVSLQTSSDLPCIHHKLRDTPLDNPYLGNGYR